MMKKLKKSKHPAEETEHSEPEEIESESEGLLVAKHKEKPTGFKGKLQHYWHNYLANKKWTIPLTVLVVLLLILLIPLTRYKVLGLFVTRSFSVTVLDSSTNKPVSEAEVSLSGKSAKTDGEGKATLQEVKPGNASLTVKKKYYEDASANVLVSLTDEKNKSDVKLTATGRQVPVVVTNKITGKGIKAVTITVLDTEAETDENGEATIVLPADKSLEKVTLKAEGYNETTSEIEVIEQQADKNKLTMTPSGKIYFLSKQSGKIDVVKTNLDGTDRQVVLAGTGKEQESDTILLASRDWKFLALKSRRDSDKPKLYLIDTGFDSLTTMDEGDADFEITGWHNHDFVYKVTRNKQYWEAKREALKSYNADKKAITVMRESNAEGTGPYNYGAEFIINIFLLQDEVIYTVGWNISYYTYPPIEKNWQIIKGEVGTQKASVLKEFPSSQSIYNSKLYEPNEVYFAVYNATKYDFYEYEDGQIKAAEVDDATFFQKPYPRYILSPDGNSLFWSEPRDGKNTFFIGDGKAEHEQEIASLSEHATYGWFTDNYLLVSKKDSELYIMSKEKDAPLVKIADYHKPAFNSNNYGGGY